jgi:hypothetical protein
MEINQTALFYEVEKITQDKTKPVSFYWYAKIHIGNADHDPQLLISVDLSRDYQKKLADEMTVTLKIPMGLWAKVIYPNRANLEITLYQQPMQPTAGGNDDNQAIPSQRFAASPTNDAPVLQGADIDRISQETLDLRNTLDITFQLFSKTVQKLRMVNVGGIFRNCTVSDVIKAVLMKESNTVSVNTGDPVSGVDMVAANNKDIQSQVILPHGMSLVDVPLYVQAYCGGVYSTGINAYIQDRLWYVYPLYDATRLNKSKKILTVIKVPRTYVTNVPVTYRTDGDGVYILATSDSNFQDSSGTNYLNYGNGVRRAQADRFMGSLTDNTSNKSIASRSSNTAEFLTVTMPQGLNNVQSGERKITSNPFIDYSQQSQLSGGIYQFVWEHANASVLIPGMTVRVLYLNGDNIEELSGVLLHVQANTHLAGDKITTRRHDTSVALSIFVNKPKATV